MTLGPNERRAATAALGLGALLLLFWFVERGATTGVAVVLAAIAIALLGVWAYREQKDADHRAALKTRRQGTYERYIAAFGNANRWKTDLDYWKDRLVCLQDLLQGVEEDDGLDIDEFNEEYTYAKEKLRKAR